MADKSRERNYVDAFSDYGLDERQTAIQNKIMTKCFKILFYGVAILTCIWIFVPAFAEFPISCQYVGLSYFMLAAFCLDLYLIRASKHGAINGITAFSMAGKGQIAVIIFAALSCIPVLKNSDDSTSKISIIIMLTVGLISNTIAHFCGKRNFEVLDGKSEDGTDESEEE